MARAVDINGRLLPKKLVTYILSITDIRKGGNLNNESYYGNNFAHEITIPFRVGFIYRISKFIH